MSLKRQLVSGVLCLTLGIISACASPKAAAEKSVPVVETKQVSTPRVAPEKKSTEVSEADVKRAVQTAVRNMMRSGSLDNPAGERYVVTVSHIFDTTKKKFDTDEIKQRLQADLAAGRKVRVISATAKDVSPQINISGRITERTAYVRKGKRQEYYLHIVLTEAKSGMMLWENVTPIVKSN